MGYNPYTLHYNTPHCDMRKLEEIKIHIHTWKHVFLSLSPSLSIDGMLLRMEVEDEQLTLSKM